MSDAEASVASRASVDARANAFDVLRPVAALAVLYSHAFALVGVAEPRLWGGEKLGTCAVYVFFALSGYLVAQSWARDEHTARFIQRRALRIFPALAGALLFTVLLLGPVASAWPWSDYFGASATWWYVPAGLSLFYARGTLPGVFEHNPLPATVNGSLWTLGYEVSMYLVLLGLGFAARCVGSARLRRSLYLLMVLLFIGAYAYMRTVDTAALGFGLPLLWRAGISLAAKPFVELGAYFFCGALLYEHRARLCFTLKGAALSVLLLIGVTPWPDMQAVAAMVIVPYAICALGWGAPAWMRRALPVDYSYGIYIYAFPIQQFISQMGLGAGWSFGGILALSLLATVLMAAASWHGIEKPAMRWRPRVGAPPQQPSTASIARPLS